MIPKQYVDKIQSWIKKNAESLFEKFEKKKFKYILFLWPIIFIGFYSFFKERIVPYLYEKAFCFFQQNTFFDSLALLATIFLLGQSIWKYNKSQIIKFYTWEAHVVLAICLLFIYDLTTEDYTYSDFEIFTFVPYLTTLSFIFLIRLVIKYCFKRAAEKRQFKFINEKSFFDLDINIDGSDEKPDDLSRRRFAEEIVKETYSVQLEKSLAISITGGWGSGKSSLMKLIEKEINGFDTSQIKLNEYELINKPIIIDFNPWLYSHNDDLITRFFEQLKESFNLLGSNLPNLLQKYVKQISSIEKGIIGTEFINNITFDSHNIQDISKKIKDELVPLKINIIVFIDDIDRLESSQIIDIFKLIRLTAKIPNMIYFASFDKSYINKSLSNGDESFMEEYYEKIFQVEFSLPNISIEKIIAEIRTVFEEITIYTIEQYEKYINEHTTNFKEIIKKEFETIIGFKYINFFFSDLRDIKRFKNQILFNIRFLKHEISLRDLIFLQLIKSHWPDLYNDLYLKRDIYLNYKNNRDKILKKIHEDKIIKSSYHLNIVEETLDALLLANNNINSIQNENNYNAYFTFNFINLTQTKYYNLYKLDNDSYQNNIKKIINNKLERSSLLEYMKDHSSRKLKSSDIYLIEIGLYIYFSSVKNNSYNIYIECMIQIFSNNIKDNSDDLKNLFEIIINRFKNFDHATALYLAFEQNKDIKEILPIDLSNYLVFKNFNFASFFSKGWSFNRTRKLIDRSDSIEVEDKNGIISYYVLNQNTRDLQFLIKNIVAFKNGLSLEFDKFSTAGGSETLQSHEVLKFTNPSRLQGVNGNGNTITYDNF